MARHKVLWIGEIAKHKGIGGTKLSQGGKKAKVLWIYWLPKSDLLAVLVGETTNTILGEHKNCESTTGPNNKSPRHPLLLHGSRICLLSNRNLFALVACVR